MITACRPLPPATHGKRDLLDALAPETRNAAKRMYERLTKAARR